MLPTLTIPGVAPPPRASEPLSNPATQGEGSDAFAHALQRAQGEPRPAHGNERRVASVEKLIQRRSQQEQQRAARREQSHSDEIAQRAHARRHIAPSPTELGDLPR